MTIGLTYNNDLSRVQVTLSDMPDGTVQVQRVANAAATDALWARGVVRGGVALPIEGGIGNLDDFEFFADIPNHYRTVPVDPPAGLLLDGASGSFASTPDDPALDITGDIEVRCFIQSADQWQGSLVNKYIGATNQRSYHLRVLPTGELRFEWSPDGSTPMGEQTGVLDLTFPVAVRATLDVDDGAGNHVVRFHSASSLDGPWPPLVDPIVRAGTTSIFNSTTDLKVGADGGGGNNFAGVIGAVQVWDQFEGFGGVLAANPDFTRQDNGATSFTDDAGRLWSVNGNATIIGIEGPESITPSLDGRVWLKSIKFPGLNRPVTVTDFTDPARGSRDSLSNIVGRSTRHASHEVRASPDFEIELMTTTADEAGKMDIILTAGTTWFLHVPANCPIPGGYVSIGDTQQSRRTRSARSPRRYFTLPCRVEAPPAPQVTGTLLVAETIFRLYGSAEALYAAHATGRSLLQTILDPSDVVVV